MANQRTTRLSVVEEPNSDRRSFLKACAALVVAAGCSGGRSNEEVGQILQSSVARPPVLWIHAAECTGCSESLLRTVKPYFDELILDVVSLDYHETLMAGAGQSVWNILVSEAEKYKGEFFCVVEGAVPTANGGIFGTLGGDRTMLSVVQEICPKSKAVVCMGNCASYGGLPAAKPNPTEAKGVGDALPNLDVPIVNLPGCPPNPINFITLVVSYLLTGTLPTLDSVGRPTFAYGKTNHAACPLIHTDRCLMDVGCMGPATHNNCTTLKFNDGTSFPMQAGHPCIGCSEPQFWDKMLKFF